MQLQFIDSQTGEILASFPHYENASISEIGSTIGMISRQRRIPLKDFLLVEIE